MTDAVASAPRPPRRGRAGRTLLLAAGVLACVLLVLIALLYLNRRAATRQLLVGWLERQGVPADLDVERVELDGLVARIRIGDPRNPDVVVERVEVDYAIGAPWSKAGLGITPSRVRLVRPVLRAVGLQLHGSDPGEPALVTGFKLSVTSGSLGIEDIEDIAPATS